MSRKPCRKPSDYVAYIDECIKSARLFEHPYRYEVYEKSPYTSELIIGTNSLPVAKEAAVRRDRMLSRVERKMGYKVEIRAEIKVAENGKMSYQIVEF